MLRRSPVLPSQQHEMHIQGYDMQEPRIVAMPCCAPLSLDNKGRLAERCKRSPQTMLDCNSMRTGAVQQVAARQQAPVTPTVHWSAASHVQLALQA